MVDMSADLPDKSASPILMDDSIINEFRAQLEHSADEVQPVSIPTSLGESEKTRQEFFDALKKDFVKVSANASIEVERIVPLDHELSKNLFTLIFDSTALSAVMTCSYDPGLIFPIFHAYKEWEELAILIGRLFNRILDLDSLKELCGWVILISGHILSPKYESQTGESSNDIFEKLLPLFQNVISYASAQFLANDVTCFVSYFGQRFFDQIFGVVDYKIFAGSFSSYRLESALNFFTNMAYFLTTGCVDKPITMSDADFKSETLKLFFSKYSCFMLPRIFFNKYLAAHKDEIMGFIGPHVESYGSVEEYVGKNLAFIFDYFMLNRKTISEDKLTSSIYHFTGHPLDHYVKRNTFQSVLVCIFHMGTDRDVALSMLKRIAGAKFIEWNDLVRNQFLGLMIDLRQDLIEQPYFGERKKVIALGLTEFVKAISSFILNTHVAKICHTLWILNSPVENFAEVWKALLPKLDLKNLIQMRYKLLFYFLQIDEFRRLAEVYLKELDRKKITNKYERESIDIKLLYSAIFQVPKKCSINPNVAEIALSAMEQNVHLTPFILPTISRQLLIDYSDYNSKAKLLDRIFELSRQANTILELSTLASFVGRITAIDPKALMNTPTWKDDSPKTNMALYTDEVGLVRKFVHEIFRWHIEAPSGGQSDMAALCLQFICQDLKFAGPKFQKIREEMPELGPYETATITANNITGYYMVPICRAEYKERIKSHSMWLVQWYRTLSRELKMIPFVILDALSKSHSGEEMPFIYADFLPVVVFQCLNEFDKKKVEEFLITEAKNVFAAVKKDSPARREDISESCQTIFQLIDDLYRIVAKDAKTKKLKKELRSNLLHFIEESLKYRICPEDIMPASVEAAQSCDNFYRAQRLLEQYSIKKDGRGVPGYDRSIFDMVQSLNFNLQEFENNEGAYAMILKNDKPTDLQTIKCAYARGDHHEILPMISGENREFMVQFLQLFNQPDLVISYIAHRFSPEERRFLKRDYPDVYQVQCQAAIELGKWDLVDTEIDRTEELIPKIDTMVDLSEIGRNSGRNSEEIRISQETSSISPETSGNEQDLLEFISDTDEESENVPRENVKLEGNGDNAMGKENVPSTDRKRAPDQEDLTQRSKKTRLSSIANGSSLDRLDDTNMVFRNILDSTGFVGQHAKKELTEDSSMMDNVVLGSPERENGRKKNFEILDESRIPGPEFPITDDLDRWELLEKYRTDTVTENAKRCYSDFEEGMRILEPLTKWTPYEDYDPIYDPTEQHTFGADLTVILQKCRTKRFEEAKKHLSLAQVYLMKTLEQQGVDNTRPYSVGYEFVQDLHTLEDLKLAWPQLSDRSMENIWKKVDPDETQDSIMEISQSNMLATQSAIQQSVKQILDAWTARDHLVRQTPKDLEPILRNRRNILRSIDRPKKEIKDGLTKLLVQSAKLARENDMTHTVLPLLTEAKKDGSNMLELEIERAYYYMEKKDSSKNPVQIMARAISDYFPGCWDLLESQTDAADSAFKRPYEPKTLAQAGNEDTKRWEESMITMLDMMSTEQISGSSKLLKLCKNLETIGAASELFFYRYTMFVDSAFEVPHDQAARLLIRLCTETMRRGDTFQHEVMPRMVTAWLDSNRELARKEKKEAEKSSAPPPPPKEEQKFFVTTYDPTFVLVRKAFSDLPKKKFYLVFSLLATRLSKAEKQDSDVVMEIMRSLINEYPHQCALLSMGEARCSTKKFGERADAMNKVFELAKQRDRRVKPILDMYRFLADNLARISSIKINADTLDLKKNFVEFTNFVHTGHRRLSAAAKKNIMKPTIPMFFKYLDAPFREIPRDAVLIHEVVNDCHVINSLARPKRLTLIGSDGEKYVILCKPTDELRKDMRFLELASMLNRRMLTSRYTKNRDYRIRTYHVVPLEETGGIIEWIPHMDTFNNCIQNGKCKDRDTLTKLREKVSKGRLPKEELYRIYIEKLIPLFHAEMGNYLRKTAMNPSAYYQKQRNYTVTTAAMCALGHIVGLGDRHLGNILVDATNGDVMHVDFNLLFNSGEMLTVPEIVPFRLTRNVVDAFGPTGVEGRFRIAFERIIKFLQAEKPAILRILKSFIYDPLIDWRIDDENDHTSYTRRSNLTNISVQDRIELVRDRLDGYLHTTIQPKIGPITDERVLVSKLIEMAMDEESLSRMYFGWSPFV